MHVLYITTLKQGIYDKIYIKINILHCIIICHFVELACSPIDNASLQLQNVDVKVVDMYKAIRDILSKYRSGKLPKAFKIVPNLANWEQVCALKPSFNVSISQLPVAAFLSHKHD